MFMPQFEYRQENENSSFSADLGFVNNYNSVSTKIKKTIGLFAKYDLDLKLNNFISSDLSISLERVSNDLLKVFFTSYNKIRNIKT